MYFSTGVDSKPVLKHHRPNVDKLAKALLISNFTLDDITKSRKYFYALPHHLERVNGLTESPNRHIFVSWKTVQKNLTASVHRGLVTCSLSHASTFEGCYVFRFIFYLLCREYR